MLGDIPIWILAVMFGALTCSLLYQAFGLWRVRLRRKGAKEYEVLQYWNQSLLDYLFKIPPAPKVIRMLDTGQIMEWKHPSLELQRHRENEPSDRP